jgi:SnoaL-like protein
MKADAFRKAVEALDLNAFLDTLSPSIVMHSPVRSEPLEGKEPIAALFRILFRTFEDLHFVGDYTSPDGAEGLHFRWRLGDQEVEGIDMMRFDEQGLIEEYTVMVRPMSAVVALRDAVWSQLAGD